MDYWAWKILHWCRRHSCEWKIFIKCLIFCINQGICNETRGKSNYNDWYIPNGTAAIYFGGPKSSPYFHDQACPSSVRRHYDAKTISGEPKWIGFGFENRVEIKIDCDKSLLKGF